MRGEWKEYISSQIWERTILGLDLKKETMLEEKRRVKLVNKAFT